MSGLHSNDVGYIGTDSLRLPYPPRSSAWNMTSFRENHMGFAKIIFLSGKSSDFLSELTIFHSLLSFTVYQELWSCLGCCIKPILQCWPFLLFFILTEGSLFIPASFLKWSLIHCCPDLSSTFSPCFTYLLRFFWATTFLNFFL